MAENKDSSFLNPLQIVLIIALVAAAGTIGHLWTKLNYLDSSNSKKSSDNTQQAATSPTPTKPQFSSVENLTPIDQDDHIRGNPDAQIALIEYSDLECPYCDDFHSTAQQLLDEYGDQIMWVYRHYPLKQLHPNTTELAIGSECAARQGGNDSFWEFIDYVFENDSTDAQQVAQTLNLNTSQFSSCLKDQAPADEVQNELDQGSAAGVTGTPGNILLNTETEEAILVPGSRPLSQFKDIIDNQLLGS